MNTVTLDSPLDMHVHFRQGAMMNKVVPLTSHTFSGAVVMPNTNPPMVGINEVLEYQRQIMELVNYPGSRSGGAFEAYMTLYMQPYFTREYLEKAAGHVKSIKMYPKGMTTNSDHGVDPDDPAINRILADMQDIGIILNVHGEEAGYFLDREKNFHRLYKYWAEKFPKLKIVMEHITDRHTAYLLGQFQNLYATITAHHLLITTDDVVGDLLNPHLFCKPVAKRPEDKEVLNLLATGQIFGHEKVMLGTDSAPHPIDKKECACGCAGVFTAPIALQLVMEVFDRNGTYENLQAFVSNNARRIYGVTPPAKQVTLKREPFGIPAAYGNNVVPMWAGQEIGWSIERVAASPKSQDGAVHQEAA